MIQFKGLYSKQRQDRDDCTVSKCSPLPLSIKILAWLNVSSGGCGEVGWGGQEGVNWPLDRSLPFSTSAPSPSPPHQLPASEIKQTFLPPRPHLPTHKDMKNGTDD